MIEPPDWSDAELDLARKQAEAHFRDERLTAPLELYLALFDEYQGVVEEFLEQTTDLSQLEHEARELLTDASKLELMRYITGPPVSADDLKVLIETRTLSVKRFKDDPDLVARLVDFVLNYHDRRRFPWVHERWEPEEPARNAAVLATTSLLAMRRLETMRRNSGKQLQERMVVEQLKSTGFKQVPTRVVSNLSKAPKAGEFCQESKMGTRKADVIIGLWDGRVMPLECKVSNSTTNSIKRLNNDAAVKAGVWRDSFGNDNTVPTAVLGGCFNLNNLKDAQKRGLTLFWAHDLQPMLDFIERTREG